MFATTRDFLSTMERNDVRYEIALDNKDVNCIHTHAIGEKSGKVFDLLVFFYAERSASKAKFVR